MQALAQYTTRVDKPIFYPRQTHSSTSYTYFGYNKHVYNIYMYSSRIYLVVLDCQVVARPLQMSNLLISKVRYKWWVGFTDFMVSSVHSREHFTKKLSH